jgi:hypothetical protein
MLLVDLGTLLTLVVVIVVAYLAVLWLALAFYVVRDARRRTTSPGFTLFAMLLGFAPPFLGALIYFMVRPPMTMEQVRSLAIEEQVLLEPPVEGIPTRPCPTCGREIEQEFILCPYCRTQFARRCTGCDRSLRLGWGVCPYCATEVGAPALARAGR